MEFCTYVNIFETKGLEYLLLMSFFVLFIFLVRFLSGLGKKNSVPAEKGSTTGGEQPVIQPVILEVASRKPR